MDGLFWTSYGIFAGLALGLGGTALGILVARARLDARLHAGPGSTKFVPHERR